MDRLYFRTLLNVLVAVVIAWVVFVAVFAPRVAGQVRRNIEATLSAPTSVLAEALGDEVARGGDADALLERARRRFQVPVELVPRAAVALDPASLARLDRGEVVETGDFLRAMVLVRVPGTPRVVKMGPINPIHPFGQGRGAGAVAVLVLGLMASVYFLLRPIRRRLASLSRAASRFGAGDLHARAALGPADALGALESSFNTMANEIQRLVGAHEDMLRTVSHELRTPLQRMHFSVAKVQDSRDPDEREQAVERLERDLGELGDLIEELLTYARLKDGVALERKDADLSAIVEDVCDGLGGINDAVALGTRAGDEARADCDVRLVRRAVSNLVLNALRHARSRVEVVAERAGDEARVEVHDDGPGVPPSSAERIFEPFWRSEEVRSDARGFGLGLAIVRHVARCHGGRVEVGASPTLGGARFRLTIPAQAP